MYALGPPITRTPDRYDFLRHVGSLKLSGVGEFAGCPTPIAFHRAVSFPAPLERTIYSDVFIWPYLADMRPSVLDPATAINLEMTLESPRLNYGRIGQVFAAKVTSISSNSTSSNDPSRYNFPPMCLKIVCPNRSRSLAREAWFYEQLDAQGRQGVLTPRCFGFFEADVSGLGLPLWEARQEEIEQDRLENLSAWEEHPFYGDPYVEDDTLPDDSHPVKQMHDSLDACYIDDEHLSYTNSDWKDWKPDSASPRMHVLLMEQLGSHLTFDIAKDPVVQYVIHTFVCLYIHKLPLVIPGRRWRCWRSTCLTATLHTRISDRTTSL